MASILGLLNEEQLAAVKAVDGPVMVFAGAGTGKTRTLTTRIAYMVKECGIKPYNVLAITFTKKATNEMRERLFSILDEDANLLNISTIHSLCVKILRKYIDRIGYKRSFEIIDEEDVQKVLLEIYKKLEIDKKAFSVKVAAKSISDYKNGVGYLTNTIEPIYTAYEQYLKDNNCVDFDNLLIKTEELFEACPEVLEEYQDKFKYILVDEFQDTNKVQYHIIRMLAEKNRNLFVVGDDDQSIYSFRGACVENMLGFKDDYEDAKVFHLVKNYRSHASILKGANALIKCNQLREKKELVSDVEGSIDDVVFRQCDSSNEEVRKVAHEIKHLVDCGECEYKDIAVIYRNSALSRSFEMSFLEERIPYNIYGGFSYLKRREVKDVISYFRFICDSNRVTHFNRIINLQPRGIGDKTIAKVTLTMESEQISLFDAIDKIYEENSSSKNKALVEFKEQIIGFQEKIETMSLVDFFDYLMEETGYRDRLKEEDQDNESNRVDNLNEFKSVLYNIDNTMANSGLTQKEKVSLGIDEIMLDQSFEEDQKKDAVTLSTVHSIKGLEFEVVFVVALEDGLFPSIRDDVEIEEERRVAYVAFTRAKSRIYLTCARKRLIYGRIVQNRPSKFLLEYMKDDEVKEKADRDHEKETQQPQGTIGVGTKIYTSWLGYGTVQRIEGELLVILFDSDNSLRKIHKDHKSIKIAE